jgi:hypothetical protein
LPCMTRASSSLAARAHTGGSHYNTCLVASLGKSHNRRHARSGTHARAHRSALCARVCPAGHVADTPTLCDRWGSAPRQPRCFFTSPAAPFQSSTSCQRHRHQLLRMRLSPRAHQSLPTQRCPPTEAHRHPSATAFPYPPQSCSQWLSEQLWLCLKPSSLSVFLVAPPTSDRSCAAAPCPKSAERFGCAAGRQPDSPPSGMP